MILLALLAAAATAQPAAKPAEPKKKPPPAHLSVPKSVRDQREFAPLDENSLSVFSDPRLAEALGNLDPKPGAWVEYAVLPKGGPQMRVRVAVLAPLRPDGSYWLEAASQAEGGPPVAVKLLVKGQPNRLRDIERALYYTGGQAPLELPVAEAIEQGADKDPTRPLPKLVAERPRDLTVAAGQFHTSVVRVEGARIFRAANVPLWGLVKLESKDRRVELIGLGTSGVTTVFPPGWGDDPPPEPSDGGQ